MNLLRETAAAWGLPLTEAQLAQFDAYGAELRRWNQQHNLTAVDDERAIITRHFLDSLRLALSWGDAPQSLADIGSGAGFPGLALKILCPELALTLVESVAKKAAFLEHVVANLALERVQVIIARAELVGRDQRHRERYDVVTARAVADLRILVEYCLPLCRVGGRVLAPKGVDPAGEIAAAGQAIETLGGRILSVEPVIVSGQPARTLVVIEKIATTPERYPRAPGIPAKRPI